MLAIVSTGIKIEGLQQFIDVSDQVGAQITAINAANYFSLPQKAPIDNTRTP